MIRYATSQYCNGINKLMDEHSRYEGAECSLSRTDTKMKATILNPDSNLKCIVIEHDNKLAGYACFFPQFSSWNLQYYLYLDCIFIKEKLRRKGFGMELIKFIQKFAVDNGFEELQWQTPSNNKLGIQFYKKIDAVSNLKERFTLGPL